jgi:hypothetical protein
MDWGDPDGGGRPLGLRQPVRTYSQPEKARGANWTYACDC